MKEQPYILPIWNIRSNWIEYDGDSIGIVNFVAHIMTASKITNSYNMELDCYVKPSQGRANIKLTGETNITDVGYIASLLRFIIILIKERCNFFLWKNWSWYDDFVM